MTQEKEERFRGYLELKALSPTTISDYMGQFKVFYPFEKELGLNQEVVDVFIRDARRSFKKRAFMKNYLEFNKRRDIDIQKLTGRRPEPKQKYISEKEMRELYIHLLKHHQSPKYFLMTRLSYECALRRAEVLGVQLNDFNWELWLEDDSRPCRLNVHGKGAKDREVIVNSDTMKLIANYLKKEYIPHQEKNKYNIWGVKGGGYINAFKKAKLKCGVDGSPHTLRNSRATLWSRAGERIEEISERLGHVDISTTQRYIKKDKEGVLSRWEEQVS